MGSGKGEVGGWSGGDGEGKLGFGRYLLRWKTVIRPAKIGLCLGPVL
jgi:hypothetical protein